MRIYIDPGHGGKDPGAIIKVDDKIYYESKINMAASLMLAGSLRLMDNDTILCRTRDFYVSLYSRKVRANFSRSDLFVSIHCNGFESKHPRGLEVLYHGTSDIGSILADRITSAIENRMMWAVLHGSGMVERSDLYVLRKTKMPAILIELGFISNKYDRQALLSHWQLSEMMKVIAETIGSQEVTEMLRRA